MASTSFFRASSSSTPFMAAPKSYDVFLSFRGEDTRYNFTDHLYQALVNRGIRTFRDDEQLGRGEAIAPELLKAIEDSRSSVIVFSENYGHSRWSLDELVKIMDCQKDVGHTVFPIFYHVDPSHVRNQTGRFGEAFAGYEENWKDKVKVGRWRTALREAGNLSGWHLQPQDGYESNYIKKITNRIFRQLNCKRVDVGTNLVGMDSRTNKVKLLLHKGSNDIRIIGIYGIGGIGKTTIAKVIYNELSWEFEYMSFVENIGKISDTQPGLLLLKNQLHDDIQDGGRGATMIKKKVFIVLDDVDHFEQLECLLGNGGWLGEGSKVIITTRNKHLLIRVDDMYEVPKLNFEEAKELFNLYAFQQNVPKLEFINLSHSMIYYCQGLPLALKVLGSLLFNKTIPQWESELHKLEREPEMEIHNVLKRSYDGLGRTEKDILLDVACFFGDEDKDFVSRILDGCNFHAEIGLQKLNDMCLLTIPYNMIQMHGLIRQMAWEIVREGYPYKPNKWRSLWDPRDIDSALTTYKGIHRVETFSLDLRKLKRVRFDPNVLVKMTRLRLLKVHSGFFAYISDHGCLDKEYDGIVKNASKMKLGLDFEFPSYELRYLCWDGYPLEFVPSNFDGENLVELHLRCSNIKQLWQGNEYLERLKVIDMSHSKKLIQMPEFSSMSNLEKLILGGCVSLIEIHPSIGVLKKLTTLDLKRCVKLKGLPSSIINLEALVVLDLSGCSSFDKFPEIQGNMRSLKNLCLNNTAIRELPNGIDFESVEILDLNFCFEFEKFPENGANMKSLKQLYLNNTAVKELPTGIANWESLPILDLSVCSKFEIFPEKVGNMKSLKELRLNNTVVKVIPNSIGDLECLELLDLSYCSKFEKFPKKVENMKSLKELCLNNTVVKDLPDSIGDLEYLEGLDLSDCSKFEKFPENVGNMKSLRFLWLKNTAVKDLPNSIGDLEYLEVLDLSYCYKFEKFPEKVGNMKRLRKLRLKNTAVKDLPDSIGDLEYLEVLDLSDCSKFEKFPEKVGNMKKLEVLLLNNTAVKDLPDSIGDLEYLVVLDLSDCSKFKIFPEKVGNMKRLDELCLKNTAVKDFPDSIGDLEYLVILDLSDCSKFEKFPEKVGNMKRLEEVRLNNTAIKDLPDSIGDLENLEVLDLSDCSKFEKFPEKVGNIKSLRKIRLKNTAVKDLPDSIGDLEYLAVLDLSYCSKFEKFPEKVGNMKRLRKLRLKNTAVKDLPDSIGDLEYLEVLDLSDCSKFEKFPEKVGNMKRLKEVRLNNTAVKDFSDNIGDLENLEVLDLSDCSKFEKFPEKVGNMKRLRKLRLKNTAVKDLPDSIGDLEYLEVLDLSGCSKFEKFPEKVGNMKKLEVLLLNNTAVKDLPDSIGDLEYLIVLDLSDCLKFEIFPEKIGNMKRLEVLLNKTVVKDLSDSIGDLEYLVDLDLSDCLKFEKFPKKVGYVKSLKHLQLKHPWLLKKHSIKGLREAGDNIGVIREESNGNHWRSSDENFMNWPLVVERMPMRQRRRSQLHQY